MSEELSYREEMLRIWECCRKMLQGSFLYLLTSEAQGPALLKLKYIAFSCNKSVHVQRSPADVTLLRSWVQVQSASQRTDSSDFFLWSQYFFHWNNGQKEK